MDFRTAAIWSSSSFSRARAMEPMSLADAEKLGAPVSKWLVKMLAVSLTAVEMEKEPTDEE